MKFLKFMFTARMSFVLFALAACLFTVLYLAWYHRHEVPVLIHQPRAEQQR